MDTHTHTYIHTSKHTHHTLQSIGPEHVIPHLLCMVSQFVCLCMQVRRRGTHRFATEETTAASPWHVTATIPCTAAARTRSSLQYVYHAFVRRLHALVAIWCLYPCMQNIVEKTRIAT
jgi:hypothetical protein